jgi:hypothetical protein
MDDDLAISTPPMYSISPHPTQKEKPEAWTGTSGKEDFLSHSERVR